MSPGPGSNKRPTGAVPKTKPQRKNSVPQEMVAPTRRDLQEHLNEFFASVAERASKPDNTTPQHQQNRTRTPAENCFDLENLTLQENTRFCWPVRPIPRRNFLHEDMNDPHSSTGQNSSGTNAAIGVVIPTTPNTSGLHHQQLHDHITNTYIANHNIRSNQTPDAFADNGQRATSVENGPQQTPAAASVQISAANIEDRLNQIQEYIRITSSLINSIQTDKPNGPRPQSVASIHSSIPNTPSYDDLNTKLDSSNRHMFHIKEQQQQLLRLQQVAKSQLQEMEHIRGQYNQMSFAGNANGQPDYDNVDDVQSDVSALMNRMKSLTDFIHNQNELASMLGEDKPGSEIMDEQLLLQRKLNELKNKKQQMANLVNELQGMNDDAKLKYQDRETTPMRSVPVEYERIVPIELVASSRNTNAVVQNVRYAINPVASKPAQAPPAPVSELDCDEVDEDDEIEEGATGINDELLGDKISEINAMKNQLNRLKEMMNTVKLIEIKNGDCDPEEDEPPAPKATRNGAAHFEAASASVAPALSLPTTTSVPIMYENVVPIHQTHQPFKPVINQTNVPVVTTIPTTVEQPQRDGEGEMEERVRTLHSMTQDLRLQAVTLAAERDRLKDIKNEIVRRNEEKDSNMKQNVAVLRGHKELHQQHQLQLQHQQEHEDLMKAQYEAKKKEFDKLVEKLDVASSAVAVEQANAEKKEMDVIYYPETWRRGQDASSASSVRSGLGGGRQSEPPTKPTGGISQNQGKDSADSGAADVLGMSVDANSLQSGSSRGFSVPPPMRNINARDSSAWRKTSQETSRISSLNQANVGFDGQHEHYPSWYYHNNYYNPGYNMGPPQSPHCPYHHGAGTDPHYNCRAMFHAGGASGSASNDPMLLQQFIQTQQMLINSVSQCNQLLWDQQREINNLNSAVLLLQERILNPNNNAISDSMQTIRAESVPPNVTCTNTQSFLPRAQSEQPLAGGCFQPNFPGYGQLPPPNSNASSYRQYPFACQNHAQAYRNTQAPQNNTSVGGTNRVRYTNNSQLPVIQQRGELNHGYGYLNDMQHMQMNSTSTAPAILNNDPNSPLLNSAQQCQQPSPPIFIHHNNNTNGASNNNAGAAIINNQLHTQQNIAGATVAAASSNGGSQSNGNAYSPNVAPALNNQVPPGNRANNYWDNFRSYSRQNLLSTNSCKSNEEACSSVNNPQNRDQQTGRNPPPSQMTHNILPGMGNKYLVHFRNQINQQNANAAVASTSSGPPTVAAPPDVLNVNQHHHQQLQQQQQQLHQPMHATSSHGQQHHHIQQQHQQQPQQANDGLTMGHASELVTNFNNFNGSQQHMMAGPSAPTACGGGGASNYNMNAAINLELNELKPKATKMLPKGSTGGSKRIRQIRERDQNNLAAASTSCAGVDLNLATTVIRQDSKSSEKLFESLKENVYLEVSALIAANESRPHFLINLFRELQLISTSDPLRNRLMQAFQELYNRYCEPTIQEESSASAQNDATPENPQHDSTLSSDNRFNQTQPSSVEYPSTESTPIRALDLQASIDEELLRTIMLEVVEFLHDIDQIGESALQRITNIVLHHLSSPPSLLCHQAAAPSRLRISHDEFLRALHNFDRRNRDIFLEGLESYLSSIFASTPPNDEPRMDKDFPQQHHQLHQQHHHHHHHHNQPASQPLLNHVVKADVTVTDDNEDLAEADQINADDSYATEDDLAVGGVSIDEHGAVGGLALSTLPDLAKDTATPTRNQLDDGAAMWMANEEEGHIHGPNDLIANGSGHYNNAHVDLKQKNQ